MALKIGTTTASLYLGSTPVAAYLGATQVYSAVQAVTLYFDGAVDSDWAEVGNWWLDDEHTEPAGRLPAEIDSVVATASINLNGGSVPTVANFTLADGFLEIPVTVTAMATFSNSATLGGGGTITGNATFNDTAQNFGTVTGTATFNDSACNAGGTAGTFVPAEPPECD
jgi:hypothetical protein